MTRTDAAHLAVCILLVLLVVLAGTALAVGQFKSDCENTGGHFSMGVTARCRF